MKKTVSFSDKDSAHSPLCTPQHLQAMRTSQSALDYAACQRAAEPSAAMGGGHKTRPNVIPRPLPPAASLPNSKVQTATPASSASNHASGEGSSGGWTSVVSVVGGMVGKLFTVDSGAEESNYVYDEKLGTWVCPSEGQPDMSGPAPPPPGGASPAHSLKLSRTLSESGLNPISSRYVDTNTIWKG